MKLRHIMMASIVGLLPGLVLAQNYITWAGGISLDERMQAPTEGTKLVFFVKSGAFLADVKVRVSNEQGEELVNTTTPGPWLILALPAGRYHVVAELNNGETQSLSIQVSGENQEFGFMFNDE